MKNWVRFLLLCLFCPQLWGQVNVTATIVDTDGQAWINGNYAVSLVLPPGVTKYYDKNTGLPFTDTFQGGLDGTGSLSLTLIPTGQISPAGTMWKFIICPQVLGAGCGDTAFPVNGTGSLSAQLNAVIPVPRVTGGPGVYAYNDMEVAAFAPNTYFNVISQKNRCYQTSWTDCGSGTGGATLPTNAIVYGLSPLTSRAAIPGQDFLSPSITNGMVPLGIATPGVNQASNIFQFQSNYCTNSTPCNPAVDTLSIQSVPVNNSQNPLMQMIFGHSGSPGGAVGLFQFPVSLPTGSTAVTQAPGDTSTDIANDAFVAAAVAAGGGGTIAHTTNVLIGDGAGNAVAGSPGTDYIYPFAFNGMGRQGLATSVTNFGSNQFQLQGSCWNGSAGVTDFFGMGSVPANNGPNALMLNVFNHFGGCNTDALGIFTYRVAINQGLSAFNIDAKYEGAFGDAYAPQDGCQATASNTTIFCPDTPFLSTDVGKSLWVQGAGAAGVAFHATITTYTDNAHVVVSAAPSTTVTNTVLNTVYGHDDSAAAQTCLQYSATNSIPCAFIPATGAPGPGLTGFLIGSAGLQLVSNNSVFEVSASHFYGSSQTNGTTMFCEFNGDCLSQAAGPITGARVENIAFLGDPTQPNGRGIELNATAGTYGNGGFWNSRFDNVYVHNFAQQCLLTEGGGGPGYTFVLPTQIDTFIHFQCDGPNQSHPAALIEMVGQTAQMIFMNGQANGAGAHSNYPNPLIDLHELTPGLGDSPDDVKFYGYTAEVGTKGVRFQRGTNLHFDDGYIENVDTPFIIAGSSGYTLNGNHIANSGNVTAVATIDSGSLGSSGSLRDNYEYGGAAIPPFFAVCTGSNGNSVTLSGNNSPNNLTSPTCRNTVVVAGGTQAPGSGSAGCTSATTQTFLGLQADMKVDVGYASDPSGLTGWGGTAGMVFQAWASAANTLSWRVCNQSGSSITYSAVTFRVDHN